MVLPSHSNLHRPWLPQASLLELSKEMYSLIGGLKEQGLLPALVSPGPNGHNDGWHAWVFGSTNARKGLTTPSWARLPLERPREWKGLYTLHQRDAPLPPNWLLKDATGKGGPFYPATYTPA